MSPTEAKTAISEIVEATQKLFPGRQWRSVANIVEGTCATSDGTRGVSYAVVVQTQDRGPKDADFAAVRKLWTRRGLDIQTLPTARPDDPILEIVGTGPAISSISFARSQYSEQINAGSVCVVKPSDDQ